MLRARKVPADDDAGFVVEAANVDTTLLDGRGRWSGWASCRWWPGWLSASWPARRSI